MKKSFVLYLAAVIGIYIGAILIAGGNLAKSSLMYFVDVPSMVLTPVVPLILMLGHYSPAEIVQAFRSAGSGGGTGTEARRALVFFRSLRRIIMFSGFLGSMIGGIFILTMYPSEDFNKNFGMYMAVCLLTVVYALFFSMALCAPFESALEKKLAGMKD